MVEPKPAWLGPENAAAFGYASVAAAYQYRPPYQDTVAELLPTLLGDEPRIVLDLGCGMGAIARLLAPVMERVDAVDISEAMVAEGRCLPGGDHPALRWIIGSAEEAPLDPPYGMVTAGASLHWMDWQRLLPRLHDLLTPSGRLVILDECQLPPPWDGEQLRIIQRYSLYQDYSPLNLVDELVRRGLFELEGSVRTDPLPFSQSLDAYVESFHARSSFVRERMGPTAAAAFDTELRTLVAAHTDGMVELQIAASVAWGRPRPAAPEA